MIRLCPECGGDLTDLDASAEMGSRPRRHERHECELAFVAGAPGLLTEVDGP